MAWHGQGRRSLDDLAAQAHRSAWNLHRLFRDVAGETPARFSRRVALDRAAARLVTTRASVASLAFDAGFASHEGFTRAFTRRFGVSPRSYRARGLRGAATTEAAHDHVRIVETASPCLHLYRLDDRRKTAPMNTEIEVKDVPGFSALVMRRRTPRDAIADTMAQCLPAAFGEAQRQGFTLVSPPFARYLEVGLGTLVLECGVAIAEETGVELADGMELISVPSGRAAVAVHHGAYEQLPDTYAAIELWLADKGIEPAGPARETYLTDPGDHPDPADWRTEVAQPIED